MNKKSILIVNDDEISCKLLKAYTSRAGYIAWTVGSAEQALANLATIRPDLIILDMKLPGMDGMTFLRMLKADATTDKIPVLATTVHDEYYSQRQAMQAGADGYLLLPIEKERILDFIANTFAAQPPLQ